MARGAFADADAWIAELKANGVPAAQLQTLQRESERAQQQGKSTDLQHIAQLVRDRTSSRRLTSPDNDSAMHYYRALATADAGNSTLPSLKDGLVTALLDQTRSASAAGNTADAQAAADAARELGAPFAQIAAAQGAAQFRGAADGRPATASRRALTPIYPERAAAARTGELGRNRVPGDREGHRRERARDRCRPAQYVRPGGARCIAQGAFRRRQGGRWHAVAGHDQDARALRAARQPVSADPHTARLPLRPLVAPTSSGVLPALLKILIVHDDLAIRLRLADLLAPHCPGATIDSCAQSAALALKGRLRDYSAAVVIVDFAATPNATDALSIVAGLRAAARALGITVIGRGGHERSAVEALRAGAIDYWSLHHVDAKAMLETLRTHALNAMAGANAVAGESVPLIAGYRLLKELSKSPHATLYLADSEEVGRPVAVKVHRHRRALRGIGRRAGAFPARVPPAVAAQSPRDRRRVRLRRDRRMPLAGDGIFPLRQPEGAAAPPDCRA